jgi:hypothetical protein
MNILLYILSVLGIVLFICILNYWDKRKDQSIFKAIKNTFMELQRKAIDNVTHEKNQGFNLDLMSNLSATVKKKLSIVYTVKQGDEGFLHTISLKMKGGGDKDFHIECMLHIIMILHSQLKQIGISEEDASIQFDESKYGTLFVELFLTPGEYERFSNKIKGTLPETEIPISPAKSSDHLPQKNKKKKNKPSHIWAEPKCDTIKKEFTVENLRYLLEDGTKESNPEYTHQQIADWCRLWNGEIHNDRSKPPEEIRDLLLDVDMQWDMSLFNTYSLDELNQLDFTQLKLPYEWFRNWAAKLNSFTEQSARF